MYICAHFLVHHRVIRNIPDYICASFLARHKVFRNIPDASFTFTEKFLGKMLLLSGAILHGLASIFIVSSLFSRDYNSSLRFLRGIHNISGWYSFT